MISVEKQHSDMYISLKIQYQLWAHLNECLLFDFFICFSSHSSFSHSAHSLGSDLPNQNIWRHEQADIPCWIPVDDRSERDFQNNDSRGTLQHPLGQAKPCILL